MQIKIRYETISDNELKIRFMHRRDELYNVSYNISGLSDAEVLELKKEAAAKFCAVFPDVPLKSVLQGFKAVDPLMQGYYKQMFPNGGWRGGGRPKGTKRTKRTEALNQRITLEEKEVLTKILRLLRSGELSKVDFENFCV